MDKKIFTILHSTTVAYYESNQSFYYSSYVIDAHARLHPND